MEQPPHPRDEETQDDPTDADSGFPASNGGDPTTLAARVHEALRGCYDPEIPVNIVEIGLVYDVRADPEGNVEVDMTLTSPNCPAAQTLPVDVETAARTVPGVQSVRVAVVWDPPWNPTMMSDAAKLELNLPF